MVQPPVRQGLLIVEASRSHSGTPHSVGLPWTSDQPHAETSLCLSQHTIHKKISMPPVGFEPRIPASERPLTNALDCAATGIGRSLFLCMLKFTAVLFVTLHCHFTPLCCLVIVLFLPHCSVLNWQLNLSNIKSLYYLLWHVYVLRFVLNRTLIFRKHSPQSYTEIDKKRLYLFSL
jgi:hypothetical protein